MDMVSPRFEFEDAPTYGAKMKVIGIGGGGGNAINRMIDEQLDNIEFIAINTDIQALRENRAPVKLHIGKKLTRGLGAGARPEVGENAVQESKEEIQTAIEDADLVFITAGMGGGTGTGAAPIIGSMARDNGALTIAIVTKPFLFEGKKRMRQAEQGLDMLRNAVDSMIVVPNERLLKIVGKGTPLRMAFKKADEILLHATRGISDLISKTGEVNVDFADVKTIMTNRGPAIMGEGRADGSNRAVDAAREAISSPLLEDVSIRGAAGILINIAGSNLDLDEISAIANEVQSVAGEDTEIIFGAVHDDSLGNTINVTVIATGLSEKAPVLRPTIEEIREARMQHHANKTNLINPNNKEKNESRLPPNLDVPTFIRRALQ
jgi:cell division protein FtsZ